MKRSRRPGAPTPEAEARRFLTFVGDQQELTSEEVKQ